MFDLTNNNVLGDFTSLTHVFVIVALNIYILELLKK